MSIVVLCMAFIPVHPQVVGDSNHPHDHGARTATSAVPGRWRTAVPRTWPSALRHQQPGDAPPSFRHPIAPTLLRVWSPRSLSHGSPSNSGERVVGIVRKTETATVPAAPRRTALVERGAHLRQFRTMPDLIERRCPQIADHMWRGATKAHKAVHGNDQLPCPRRSAVALGMNNQARGSCGLPFC